MPQPQSFQLMNLPNLLKAVFKRRHLSQVFCAGTLLTAGLIGPLLSSQSFARLNANLDRVLAKETSARNDNLEARLAPKVTQQFKALGVSGAIIGVWMKGYQPWITTLGVSDLATGTPIKLNDKMRIGSITKTFTGTILLQLVDEGKLSLNDPVSKYLPDVPNGENITIRQIGTMTSGLFNYSEDKVLEQQISANPNISWTPQALLAVAFRNPPDFLPGQGASYSNTNSILLGLIIEKLTGHSLPDEIRTRITQPLGMQQTTFATDGMMPNPHSQGYLYGTFNDPVVPEGTPPNDVTTWNPSWTWAAGAMISTLDDLYRYAKPLAMGKLLSKKTQAERLTWVNMGGIKYGFQIANYGGAIGHNGSIPGYQSFMGYLPKLDATVIILTNLQHTWSPNGQGPDPADSLAQVIVEELQKI
ncbi:MAG: beta-lactamase family protein [Chroococcidiopsidaceae cyanobacterium CP_BM_ER_R8_30]|nr:beta-lactamase family protein [Chroococcidiopsidaceae cyanobacterium CP_BM_ER_R8_30]